MSPVRGKGHEPGRNHPLFAPRDASGVVRILATLGRKALVLESCHLGKLKESPDVQASPRKSKTTDETADRTHFAMALLTWQFVGRSVEHGTEYTLSLAPRLRSELLMANCIYPQSAQAEALRLQRYKTKRNGFRCCAVVPFFSRKGFHRRKRTKNVVSLREAFSPRHA